MTPLQAVRRNPRHDTPYLSAYRVGVLTHRHALSERAAAMLRHAAGDRGTRLGPDQTIEHDRSWWAATLRCSERTVSRVKAELESKMFGLLEIQKASRGFRIRLIGTALARLWRALWQGATKQLKRDHRREEVNKIPRGADALGASVPTTEHRGDDGGETIGQLGARWAGRTLAVGEVWQLIRLASDPGFTHIETGEDITGEALLRKAIQVAIEDATPYRRCGMAVRWLEEVMRNARIEQRLPRTNAEDEAQHRESTRPKRIDVPDLTPEEAERISKVTRRSMNK